MKQLVLTGMATEHDFSQQKEQYVLVFNKGELRVPVSEEAAQEVIKSLFGDGPAQPESNGFTQEDFDRERSAMQEENRRITQQGPVMSPVGSTYSDDDGVESI